MTDKAKAWLCPKCYKKKRANYIFQPNGVTCSECGKIVHCVWKIPYARSDKADYIELAEEFKKEAEFIFLHLYTPMEQMVGKKSIDTFARWLNERMKKENA